MDDINPFSLEIDLFNCSKLFSDEQDKNCKTPNTVNRNIVHIIKTLFCRTNFINRNQLWGQTHTRSE